MVSKRPSDKISSRLAFCERSTTRGGVDGVWWPNSADLRTELPDLMSILGSMIGEVRRVVYDPRAWRTAPSRVIRRGVAVCVDPYSLVSPGMIYLVGSHSRDAVLSIVPASCATSVGDRVLAAVTASTVPMTASVVVHLLGSFAEAEGKTA
ncbi:MAG: hypothetical protein K0R01_3577 [Mycobacterium sp.]|jgi:hypothetical protein|nr:hypothetical protein [Mycobacterium sp.]